jgi:hypothetical protein
LLVNWPEAGKINSKQSSSSCLYLSTFKISKPGKTSPWFETMVFPSILWRPQNPHPFPVQAQSFHFKPHIGLENDKPDLGKCQTFRIEFHLIATDVPFSLLPFSRPQ